MLMELEVVIHGNEGFWGSSRGIGLHRARQASRQPKAFRSKKEGLVGRWTDKENRCRRVVRKQARVVAGGDGWSWPAGWLGAGTATPRQLELSRDPATLLPPLFKSTTPLLD